MVQVELEVAGGGLAGGVESAGDRRRENELEGAEDDKDLESSHNGEVDHHEAGIVSEMYSGSTLAKHVRNDREQPRWRKGVSKL
jgi:hypothetical protein